MLSRKVLLVFGEAALIGAQKATIAERLVRSEGNDVSPRIINEISRNDSWKSRGFGGTVIPTRVEAVEGCNRHEIATRKGRSLC
jgi:hypothetical protein